MSLTSNNRRPLLLAVSAVTLVGLVGCGHPGQAGPAAVGFRTSDLSQVASVNGQPEIIVKRKDGARVAQGPAPRNLRLVRRSRIPNVEIHAVTDGKIDAALAALQKDPSVEYAEANQKMSIPETREALHHIRAARAAQDINFPGEYGPRVTHALDLQAAGNTGEGQTIAIVDTGIDLTHPDLAPKLVPGTNTVDPSGTAADDDGHGTNCAGISASLKDDEGGIVGMAPGAKLMPVKVLGADGSGSDASVAEGIRWAADHGATVISLSLGGPGETKTGAAAVKYALGKGAVIVAAMGNDGTGGKSFPAAYPGVIAVGATDITDTITSFSQFGKWISVSAPGYSILSTFPTYHVTENDDYEKDKSFWESVGMRATPKYGYLTGTSQATPHVAGLAALARAKSPNLKPDAIKTRIEGAAIHPQGMAGAFDVHYGNGRIDALKI